MVWCAAAGVITGKQLPRGYYLDPQAGATRAEAAKVLVQADSLADGEIDPYLLDDLIQEGAEAEAQALAGEAEADEQATTEADSPDAPDPATFSPAEANAEESALLAA